MKTIGLQTIMEKMKNDASGYFGCGIALLLFLAGIFVMAGAAMFSVYGLVPIGMFGIPGIVLLCKSQKTRKGQKEKRIYIVTDVCCAKRTECSGEDGDAYILTFESGLERTLKIDDAQLSSVVAGCDEEWLYHSTERGDRFYLVYIQGSKKPCYVFPQKLCQLDMTDFVEENGCIRPRMLA